MMMLFGGLVILVSGLDLSRFNQLLRLSGEGLRVLNLGDSKFSQLTTGLKLKGHKVVTVDARYNGEADYYQDLECGVPYFNNKFDLVVAGELFEHVYNLSRLLSSIRGVLKSNGSLLISVPNIFNLFDRFRFLLGMLPVIMLTLISISLMRLRVMFVILI